MDNAVVKYTVTIPSGAATSEALALPESFYLAGVIIPVMTTSTSLKFQVSVDGITYYDFYDQGGTLVGVTFNPANTGAYVVKQSDFNCWAYLKVNVANNQAADRTIGLVLKTY